MNILLIGSGGREHAFSYYLSKSKLCSHLYVMPGNAGTALCGTNVSINPLHFDKVAEFCAEKNIELILVGPEEPLVKGMRNYFESNEEIKHIKFVGPDQAGAAMEGSKDWSKAFMAKYNVPTATYKTFTAENLQEGLDYVKKHSLPIVLKADGLAAGKGVLICQTHAEAEAELEQMINQSKFGDASKKVVVEAFLDGIELSVFVLCDGDSYKILPSAKDYKRIGEGDQGLNTGGMGAISPVPFADEQIFLGEIGNYTDDQVAVIPDFIANCGMARVFAYCESNDDIDLSDEAIFKDSSKIIWQAMMRLHQFNPKHSGFLKKGLEMALVNLTK
jgi:phosphoribosylamine--glycine ligase